MVVWNIIRFPKSNIIRLEIRQGTLHQLCELADHIDLGLGTVDVVKYMHGIGRLYFRPTRPISEITDEELRSEINKLITVIAPF